MNTPKKPRLGGYNHKGEYVTHHRDGATKSIEANLRRAALQRERRKGKAAI